MMGLYETRLECFYTDLPVRQVFDDDLTINLEKVSIQTCP